MEQHPDDHLQLKKRFISHWRQYRHDLLNQMQLVKSYYQLGRMDDMMRCIDQFVVRVQQESLLSKLDDPELVYMLLTYNYESHPLYLDIELTLSHEEMEAIADQKSWFNMVKELVSLMEKGCKPGQNQPLPHFSLVLERHADELSLSAELQGGWDTAVGSHIMERLREKVTIQQGKLVEYNHHNHGVMFEIRMPWPESTAARHSPGY